MFYKNPRFIGMKLQSIPSPETLEKRYLHKLNRHALAFLKGLLKMDPNERLTAT